jgi:hypothetical protein
VGKIKNEFCWGKVEFLVEGKFVKKFEKVKLKSTKSYNSKNILLFNIF